MAAVKPLIVPPRPALAQGRVRHVGDPVAFVVADSEEIARDVAGMLRSFAYAAEAAPHLRGVEAPDHWERAAREEFLAGYRSTVDPALVPSGRAMDRLLGVFELEKAVYELRYELNHRPDWVAIPAAGIARMLAQEVPV